MIKYKVRYQQVNKLIVKFNYKHINKLNKLKSFNTQINQQELIMFRKTIQNIQTTRVTTNPPIYPQQQDIPQGYNTQRYQRYPQQPPQQQNKLINQRKNISSGQFSQLKKVQIPKPSELIIRQCDINELNHYKKPIRPSIEQNIYQFTQPGQLSSNSSNKKQRIAINSRKQGGYDSNNNYNSNKQVLQQLHYIERQNKPLSSQRYSSSSQLGYYQLQQQFESLKQYIFKQLNNKNIQKNLQTKKIKQSMRQLHLQCMGQLQSFANQISKQFNKQKQQFTNLNKRSIDTQRQLRYLKDNYNSFVKDNQQKIQSLVLEINGFGINKKSKINQQFGIDLKSSSHCISGVGTSMSVNFQNDNINLKLYNETSAQIQMLKAQLQMCKQKIQLLQKDTKILQSQRMNSKSQIIKQNQKDKQGIDLRQIQKMIIYKFSQQRKKYSLNQKIQQLDKQIKDLYRVSADVDSNIKGMNAQFTRVINGTVIKKQKMLQAKLNNVQQKVNNIQQKVTQLTQKVNQLTQKLNPQKIKQIVNKSLKPQMIEILQRRSQQIKVIKIRQQRCEQKLKLQSLKDSQYTYLLDEEGYLLDSSGNYIVETKQNGTKEKIKIQKNIIYLLQTNGISIKNINI